MDTFPNTYQSKSKIGASSSVSISTSVPWKLLSFSVLIFGFTLFIYLGIVLGYKPFLDKQNKDLNNKIAQLNQSADENQQQQLINFYSQLINVQNIINARKSILPIFDLIEKNTYLSVSYSNLTMDSASRTIKLGAQAPNYETLIKEIAIFKNAPEIQQVVIENIAQTESMGKTSVRCGLKLILK